MAVLSLFTHSMEEWKKTRLKFLSRLIVLAHVREVTPKGATKYSISENSFKLNQNELSNLFMLPHRLSDGEVKLYNVYRPMLIFFALVNKLQHVLKVKFSHVVYYYFLSVSFTSVL